MFKGAVTGMRGTFFYCLLTKVKECRLHNDVKRKEKKSVGGGGEWPALDHYLKKEEQEINKRGSCLVRWLSAYYVST